MVTSDLGVPFFLLLLRCVSGAIIEGDIAVRTSGSPTDVSDAFFTDNPVRCVLQQSMIEQRILKINNLFEDLGERKSLLQNRLLYRQGYKVVVTINI